MKNNMFSLEGKVAIITGGYRGIGKSVAKSLADAGADIMAINMEKSMELRKTVRQFAQNNPEIAALIIKNWLRGEEE